jgi:putative FmdB family regulatory protein
MPTYDYECSKCANKFEGFHKMTDKPVAKCPKCGGKASRLISSGSGVIFKGSGFYETDYKKKSPSADKSCPSQKGEACKGCSLGKKEKNG